MSFQRVSVVLSLSSDGNVLDFLIEKSEGLKTELKEAPSVKSQRIECEKCRNELELCLWLQKSESLDIEKLEQHWLPVKEELLPEPNAFEPLLEIEEKPEVKTLLSVSSKKAKRSRKKKQNKSDKNPEAIKKEILECDLCNRKFISKTSIAAHLRRKHRVEDSSSNEFCYHCGDYVPTKQFKKHLMSHSDSKYECDICLKKFIDRHRIFNHMKLEHLERPNVKTCKFCGKRFLKKHTLEEHVARHENLRQFKCDQCPKDFNTLRAVDLHKIKIHKTEERKKIYCHICGHVSHFKSGFEQHQLTHLSDLEKPYPCPHCPKGFTKKVNFERHLWVHSGEKPMKCEICLKGFREQNRLQSHMRKHTGEKPFICSVPGCEKRYADPDGYRCHLRIHERQLKITLDKSTRKFQVDHKASRLLANVNKS